MPAAEFAVVLCIKFAGIVGIAASHTDAAFAEHRCGNGFGKTSGLNRDFLIVTVRCGNV